MDDDDFYNDDSYSDQMNEFDQDSMEYEWDEHPPLRKDMFSDEFSQTLDNTDINSETDVNESHPDQHSLLEEVYQKDQMQVKELELNKKDKNWIPDDIMLTTQDDGPIIYINSTHEKPEIYQIKLATITLNAELPINFNLKVIALYLPLDDHVIGIKCEQVCERGWLKPKPPPKKKKKKKKGRKDRADFYNQCTINVKPYGLDSDELINMKLFPNGKISFTGVKKVVDAEVALKYILKQIAQLNGPITYFLKYTEYGNSKNFRKKIKLRQPLLEYISNISDFEVNWTQFIDSIQTKGKNPYPYGLTLPFEVAYALTFMEIVLTYYDLPFLEQKGLTTAKLQEYFDHIFVHPQFKELCEKIKTSFTRSEFTQNETMVLVNYMAADKNKAFLLDQITDYLQNNHSLPEIKIILSFYLNKDDNITIESIVDSLDKNNYQYETISEIKTHLIKFDGGFSFDDTKLLYKYFKQLRISNNPILTLTRKNAKETNSEAEAEAEVEEVEVEEVEEQTDVDETDATETDETDEARFNLNLTAWSDKEGRTHLHDLDIMDYYSSDYINISNINTTFNTNFVLSREKLHQLLVSRYHQTNCSLEPNYGGIKLTYLSTIDCQKHNDPNDPDIVPEYNGCHCKGVSVLIFPNITLITGGRSFRQILQAYEFIKGVMIKEFERIIKIDKNQPDPQDKYPNVISSNKHVYMKKKFILDNPRNHFILRKIGILSNFN